MQTEITMRYKNLLVMLVAVFALAIAGLHNVSSINPVGGSTFAEITSIEVNGVEVIGGTINLANFAGERITVRVTFAANATIHGSTTGFAEDTRVIAWISGERRGSAESERFDVLAGRVYTKTLFLDVPFDLDERLEESRKLIVEVESEQEGVADSESIGFTVERSSYVMEILHIEMPSEVKSGEALPVDVVLKNRGRKLAEDTILRVSIPELGLETTTYYGDIGAQDQGGNVKERDDSIERRTFLRIPLNAPSGLYNVRIESFNSEAYAETEKRVFVTGAKVDTRVIGTETAKNFFAGERREYKVTLVNTGNIVRVYELVVNAPSGLQIDLSESLVVVPAGSSRTISFFVESENKGNYVFTINTHSDTGELLESKTFRANIEESDKTTEKTAQNATVLLTVILAIIFVVLLVVLIVLLTRKPEQKEEFGESYY